MEYDLWVVIPTYNRVDDLLDCLHSLIKTGINEDRVIVVDNHSQDDTAQKLASKFPEVNLIALEENFGAAKASNLGFEVALQKGAELVLRLDSDTVVDSEFCLRLLGKVGQYPDVGVFSPKIYFYEPSDEIWFAGANQHRWHFGATQDHRYEKDAYNNSQVREIDYVWGAAMLIKREVLQKTGGFDTDFFIYYEEVDFCLRVKELGYKLLLIPDSYVWHKVGSAVNNARTAFHWNRSKILLFRKHARNRFHLVFLFTYSFFYTLYSWILRNNSGNRGPIKDALTGLHNGMFFNISKRKR